MYEVKLDAVIESARKAEFRVEVQLAEFLLDRLKMYFNFIPTEQLSANLHAISIIKVNELLGPAILAKHA
jgi:hypothetical protein